ncbi:MAG: cytochrome c biogenesis protein CcsA [Bacteroidota bacterium]|nr:cytochrome c biogenesis protein [Candidatus Kapabacteria bacterium]MCS7302640.1 cytochrome c biogenesis protein [Candidatus Kapabacteria bacterium]MCX7936245.1 cytochrome c biogenesis protein [Chlorobiota bacterium]MDW8074474.1 cytochrome c biogenesis protein CcsA [Bacteroidota bacterium]MDW8271050.1 cytochrome c biogenesis protein CcsA [Bacteroidota bacterium]
MMKYAYYILGILVGLGIGWGKGIIHFSRLRSVLTVFFLFLGTTLAIISPIAGTFNDLIRANLQGEKILPWVLVPPQGVNVQDSTVQDISGQRVKAVLNHTFNAVMANSIQKTTLIKAHTKSNEEVEITDYITAPPIILPHIPSLGEKARIMFFHVPLAWIGFIAYVITMIFSIRFLIAKSDYHDRVAYSSAYVGTAFTVLAYLSGAIWARFNWGHFFNWDMRELSVLLLLLIYAGYFILRSNITNEQIQQRISATYATIAGIAAAFLIFILPRLTISLHPGSKDDTTIGPILSPQQDALDVTKAVIFSLMLAGFSLLFTWLLSIVTRYMLLKKRLDSTNHA